MNKVLMTAAAVFFAAGAALAQETASVTTATDSTCGFEAKGTSTFECAAAAQVAFQKFAKEAASADVSDYLDKEAEAFELRLTFQKWVKSLDSADLAKGQPLRQMVEAADKDAKKAMSAVSKLQKQAVDSVSIELPRK